MSARRGQRADWSSAIGDPQLSRSPRDSPGEAGAATYRAAAAAAPIEAQQNKRRHQQQQVQVHRFDQEQEDEEEEQEEGAASHEEEEEEEEKAGGGARRIDSSQQDYQQDPYNRQQYYYSDDDLYQQHGQQQHQLFDNPLASAYDSMSTILEVDSEEVSQRSDDDDDDDASRATGATTPSAPGGERPRALGTPLEVRATPLYTSGARHAAGQHEEDDWMAPSKPIAAAAAGSPVGRVSPEDKFGGALSALAAQMERLSRRADAMSGSKSPTTATPAAADTKNDDQNNGGMQQDDLIAKERPSSPIEPVTERLMMISPIMIRPIGVAGNLKFPLAKRPLEGDSNNDDDDDDDDRRRVVEVSNKSTSTSIDLGLMDKLLERYFVERHDKATQSIKFDCDLDDEFDIIEQANGLSSLSRRRSRLNQEASGELSKPRMRSVSVGTEKFSRERFSLLPQTHTRSTQTRPNLSDNDLGISETRRFKLSHLSDLGLRLRTSSAASKAAKRDDDHGTDDNHQSGRNLNESTSKAKVDDNEDETATTTNSPESSASESKQQELTARADAAESGLKSATTGSLAQKVKSQAAKSASVSFAEPDSLHEVESVDEDVKSAKRLVDESRSGSEASSDQSADSLATTSSLSPVPASGPARADHKQSNKSPQQQQLMAAVGATAKENGAEKKTSVARRHGAAPQVKSPTMATSESVIAGEHISSSKRDKSKERRRKDAEEGGTQARGGGGSGKLVKNGRPVDGEHNNKSNSSRTIARGKGSGIGGGGGSDEPHRDGQGNGTPGQQRQHRQCFYPNLKTELRVIIEFANADKRQRNEMTSNSQLIDGKLSKRTEVTASRHSAVSPRAVMQKLELAGQRHSMQLKQQQMTAKSSPLEVPSTSSAKQDSASGDTGSGRQWHEVSKSTVCNEIEADTRKSAQTTSGGGGEKGDIIVSSVAKIKRAPDESSAIELSSRAVRTQESSRDSVPGGEQVLVESSAAFDESQVASDQERQQEQSGARVQEVSAGATTGRPSPAGQLPVRSVIFAGDQERPPSRQQRLTDDSVVRPTRLHGQAELSSADGRQFEGRPPSVSSRGKPVAQYRDNGVETSQQQRQHSSQMGAARTKISGSQSQLYPHRDLSEPIRAGRAGVGADHRPAEQIASPSRLVSGASPLNEHHVQGRPTPIGALPGSSTGGRGARLGAEQKYARPMDGYHLADSNYKPQPQQSPGRGKESRVPRQLQQSASRARVQDPTQARPPQQRLTRIEFEEESEDRHQVTQNGRLVYDDRLREHRYESHRDPPRSPSSATAAATAPHNPRPGPRTPTSPLRHDNQPPVNSPSPARNLGSDGSARFQQQQQRQRQHEAYQSASALGNHHRVNFSQRDQFNQVAGVQRPQVGGSGRAASMTGLANVDAAELGPNQQAALLLKPVRLQQPQQQQQPLVVAAPPPTAPGGPSGLQPIMMSPPILFADQTSNLSSDPETMDSGFVHSGAGSSNNINQQQHHQQQQQQQSRLVASRQPLGQRPKSVNFNHEPAMLSPPLAGLRPGAELAAGSGRLSSSGPGQLDRRPAVSLAGSSRRPLQQHQQQQQQQHQRYLADTSELEHNQMNGRPWKKQDVRSLTFVDEDEDDLDDELVRQLGASGGGGAKRASSAASLLTPTSGWTNSGGRPTSGGNNRAKVAQQTPKWIAPPLASKSTSDLRSSNQAAAPRRLQPSGGEQAVPWYREPRLRHATSSNLELADTDQQRVGDKEAFGAPEHTELTTRLTRCKFKKRPEQELGAKRRTITRLDQNLIAVPIGSEQSADNGPKIARGTNRAADFNFQQGQVLDSKRLSDLENCRFKTQVVFESDTDSATDRQSSTCSLSLYKTGAKRQILAPRQQRHDTQVDSSDNNNNNISRSSNKQLITETKYSLTSGGVGQVETTPMPTSDKSGQNGAGQSLLARGPQPNWEYSLRVNRMRGNKVTGKAK